MDVRLNTNESPLPPPPSGWTAFASGLADDRLQPLSRPRGDRAPRGAGRAATASTPNRSSAPTVPTRCSSRCCSPTAGRAGRWPSSSPPTRSTATSPGSPAPRWSRAAGTDDFCSISTRSSGSSRPADPVITFLCSPNNPTGRAEPLERGRGGACAMASGLVVVDEAYGQFAAVLRARPGAPGRTRLRPAGGGPDLLQDLVHGRAPARLPGRPAARWSRPASWWPCRTTSTRPSSWPAGWPCGFVDEMETRVAMLERGAGPDGRRPGRAARGDLALGRQLHPVPADGQGCGGRCGRISSTRRSSCETVRSGRASPGASGSRWGSPRRTTASWPH